MFSTFPRVKFVDTNNFSAQLDHIESELREVMEEHNCGSVSGLVMELLDLAHSVETALRILEEQSCIDIEEHRAKVIKKNQGRGYYEV